MIGFDDAAMMGLGALNSGIQAFGAQQQAAYNRKLQKIQRAQAKRHYESDIKNVNLESEDTSRQAYFRGQDQRSDIIDQQGPGGSLESVARQRLQGERDRRLSALDRQSKMLTADWLDQNRMWKIQDKMAKSARTMSLISGILMQGGSGAAGAMGG